MYANGKVIENRLGLKELDRQLEKLLRSSSNNFSSWNRLYFDVYPDALKRAVARCSKGKLRARGWVIAANKNIRMELNFEVFSPGKEDFQGSLFVCLQRDSPIGKELLEALHSLLVRRGEICLLLQSAREKSGQRRHANHTIESEICEHLCAQDTFYVEHLYGVGHVYQQTFIDPFHRVAFAKLYDRKSPLVAVDLLNSRVIPFFEENRIPITRILTDRGREFCGSRDHHKYELYLNTESIAHITTRTKNPQGNPICTSFHQALFNEFYNHAFRRKLYTSVDALQVDLDEWVDNYNANRLVSPIGRRLDRLLSDE